jgi:murein DD-endopeptidase MepM/ murein hydrolase activator NlpD
MVSLLISNVPTARPANAQKIAEATEIVNPIDYSYPSSAFGIRSVGVPIVETDSVMSQPEDSILSLNVPVAPIINVLQVYPDGHSTTVVAQAIYNWSTMFHIDVLPVTSFNGCSSVTCSVTVVDPMTGQTAIQPIKFYDVLYFGVADSYGQYDLSTTSASVVREFAKLGKGIVFTHDTVLNWADSSSGNPHPNFTSLIDVHGLNIGVCPFQTFMKVKLISDNKANPVLNSPFRLPSSFDTSNTHWGCQNVVSGTAWYNGTDSTSTADYHLYMQTYFNESYGSHSSFYSYGHTETIPLEWEAKAMINSMYFAYRGSGPALDLPVDYSSYPNFATAAQGNIRGEGPGRVNSWFDHEQGTSDVLKLWNGTVFTQTEHAVSNCQTETGAFIPGCTNIRFHNCNTQPGGLGLSCYDGHNGIDFSHDLSQTNEPVFAASPGTVISTTVNPLVSYCKEGRDKDQSCGGGFGNQVWIDHGGGYATLYAHLRSVTVTVGVSVTASQPIGIMGDTGHSDGTHLHFGLYYHQNLDGNWTGNEAVDPYGWLGPGPDPWNATSVYLWKHTLWTQQTAGSSGGTVSSQSGNTRVDIPPGALTFPVTLELWDTQPVAASSAQVRSTGRAFWLRVLEWLTGSGNSGKPNTKTATGSFTQPATLTVTYGVTETQHLDTSKLTISRWNDSTGAWVALPTAVDTNQKQATAQTTEIGNFDLQAPPLCPADSQEPDDKYYSARTIAPDGTQVSDLFDIAQDEDWFKLDAVAWKKYLIQTSNLAAGVDTLLQVYDQGGVTVLTFDDNSGGGKASRLLWQAPQNGTYFVRVTQTSGSAYGCSATYQLSVMQLNPLYLPLVLR